MSSRSFLLDKEVGSLIYDIVNCQINMMPKANNIEREFLKHHYQTIYPFIIEKRVKNLKRG